MTDSNRDRAPEAPARPTSGQAPRWGEYAPAPDPTVPDPTVSDLTPHPTTPDAVPPGRAEGDRGPTAVAPGGSDQAPAGQGTDPDAAANQPRRPRLWDRILTIALLVYGLITVVGSLTGGSDLARSIEQVYEIQDIGEFTTTNLASTLTTISTIFQLALFAAVAMLSYRMLRANRITFWVPLAGGVLASLVVAVFGLVLMLGDPAFQEFVNSQV